MKIDSFTGEYRFLSNFYPCNVEYDGVLYPSSEHAYQAAKSEILEQRDIILKAKTAGQAKRLGKFVTMREDWNTVRYSIMAVILTDKFKRNPSLMQQLKATGDAELIEGNNWNDTYWGVCNGKGANNLGKILMEIRNG